MFSLEVEWLLGVCFAARTPADDAPDWPPQPDRVFSALAASWGARGQRPDERASLEWLETLDPPELYAASPGTRVLVTAYVPPNDATAADVRVLPWLRRRQPRRFPAAPLPLGTGELHLRLTWNADPTAEHLATLNALASDTSYLGHSSSLVRCMFHTTAPGGGALQKVPTFAAPYRGRLRELESLNARHSAAADASARPRRTPLARTIEATNEPTPQTDFGQPWPVFEFVSGARPDLRGAAVAGRTMRDALMSVWPDPIPEWLSGHAGDGAPSRAPHLAVVPLANVGFPFSDAAWHGLALVLPRVIEDDWHSAATPASFAERQRFDASIRRLAAPSAEENTIALRLPGLGIARLRRTEDPARVSLRPARYSGLRALWSTATPIVLDRHPKGPDRTAEAEVLIAESCQRIGLPRPIAVRVHKHAAISAAPSAWPAGGSPRWNGWARPNSLATRPLTHATLRFAAPVRGPVILGAGRFFGLGLCLPFADDRPR